jgi:hypothetical protein
MKHLKSRVKQSKDLGKFNETERSKMKAGMLVLMDELESIKDKIVAEKVVRRQAAADRSGKIDFVYCWAGEDMQHDYTEGDTTYDLDKQHHTGEGLNEIQVSIRSVQLYAPWVNKIYMLVNGPAQVPAWAAKDKRIEMVDRCSLFPKKEDCPTANTAACQAVLHRVPNLQERFVYMEDDWFIKEPVKPTDMFLEDGRPLLSFSIDDSRLTTMYGHSHSELIGPDLPPAKTPDRIKWFMHVPLPMTVSFTSSLEEEFADWFAFVRSHKHRFTCCNASNFANGFEEDFTMMYPAMLYRYDHGVHSDDSWGADLLCECWDTKCQRKRMADKRQKSLTIQNCVGAGEWQRARSMMFEHMKNYIERENISTEGYAWSFEPPVKGKRVHGLPIIIDKFSVGDAALDG